LPNTKTIKAKERDGFERVTVDPRDVPTDSVPVDLGIRSQIGELKRMEQEESGNIKPAVFGYSRRKRRTTGLPCHRLGSGVAASRRRLCISQLEHDKKSPTIDVLFRICGALGLSASRLIARVEEARQRKQSTE
jgi:hypothetical protein